MSSVKRVFRYENGKIVEVTPSGTHELNKPIVSDSMGFIEEQFEDFEKDRVAHGFVGVEFKRDPDVPQFYQVHISSEAEKARYLKHRGMTDRNGLNGGRGAVGEEAMRKAEAWAKENWPVSPNATIDAKVGA
jgi:hypothetical protein